MTVSYGYFSMDKLDEDDQSYLLAALMEFILSYQMHVDGEFPEFLSKEYQQEVKEMDEKVNEFIKKASLVLEEQPISNFEKQNNPLVLINKQGTPELERLMEQYEVIECESLFTGDHIVIAGMPKRDFDENGKY